MVSLACSPTDICAKPSSQPATVTARAIATTPTADHLALANLEREGRAAVAARVKLLRRRQQRDRIGGEWMNGGQALPVVSVPT